VVAGACRLYGTIDMFLSTAVLDNRIPQDLLLWEEVNCPVI
jgi:hypothetical protein